MAKSGGKSSAPHTSPRGLEDQAKCINGVIGEVAVRIYVGAHNWLSGFSRTFSRTQKLMWLLSSGGFPR
jgi:hypothetical protein